LYILYIAPAIISYEMNAISIKKKHFRKKSGKKKDVKLRYVSKRNIFNRGGSVDYFTLSAQEKSD